VIATVAAFVLHLALRGRTVDLGYKLGRTRAEQARLREVKRVLSLEAASYQTPQRVEMVARTLLGMTPPPAERVFPMRAPASTLPPDEKESMGERVDYAVMNSAPSASAAASAAPGGGASQAATAIAGAAAPPRPPAPKAPPVPRVGVPADPYDDPSGAAIIPPAREAAAP
jgi:cell division protein FtsL